MTYFFQKTKIVDGRKRKIKWKISFEGCWFFFGTLNLTEKQNNKPSLYLALNSEEFFSFKNNTDSFITFTTTKVRRQRAHNKWQ